MTVRIGRIIPVLYGYLTEWRIVNREKLDGGLRVESGARQGIDVSRQTSPLRCILEA